MLWFTGMLEVCGFTITVMTNRNIWIYDVLYGQWWYKNAWWLYGCMMVFVDDRDIRNVWWLYGCMMTYMDHRDIRMHDDLDG